MIIPYLKVEQPIGTFYLSVIKASVLKAITEVNIRTSEGDGIQRSLKDKRIKEISTFCKDSNATFPTSIVVSVYDTQKENIIIDEENKTFKIQENIIIGEILDGQHRLEGLEASGVMDKFDLPVVLMFDMSIEENAYVFTTINSKQTKINPSHIIDLQEYSTVRSPQKTAHMIAKALNTMPESAFHGRMKMLGASMGDINATLSQGTFASQIMQLYSKNPDEDARRIKNKESLQDDLTLPLRHYFIAEEDHIILKILLNCFNALSRVFVEESKDSHKSVLWKTTGFSAIVRSFPEIYRLGEKRKDLSESFFEEIFSKVRDYMKANNIPITGEFFGGGGKQVQQNLAQWIITATQQ